ncbi:coenzyme a pyrophosphatase [Dorcoceras hygrometricum]|uniref:Coenzyme a pyrophosphatase n=1 Tax=Dorcoceras hygrometricum TaxID=472368 RepID=A0A2Z7CMB5_9LAMI|nr:coenzyme a pyrophosphatase [Dorcoceras hygrometricum]
MSFVKDNVIYDCCESMIYDDQTSQKLNHNGKAGIGFQKPENSKPRWLKNKLDKDKAKADRKPFVPNQPWQSSTKVKPCWKKVQPKRDLSGQMSDLPKCTSAGSVATNVQPHDDQSDVAPTDFDKPDVAQAVASIYPLVSRSRLKHQLLAQIINWYPHHQLDNKARAHHIIRY